MPKTKKTTHVMPTTAAAGLIPAGLGTDFETVQIIPTTGYWATYKDGSRYPVVAWAMQSRLLKDDERRDFDDKEIPPAFISRVIGLVMFAKESTLIEADNYLIAGGDDFTGYEYDL